MPELNSNLLDYNKGKQDYILARLIIAKQYIEKDQIADAIECIDTIIHDIDTDYDNRLK